MAQSIDVREARKMKSSSVDLELAPTHSEMNPPARFSAMASQAKDKLRSVGLRPTRTRIALAYMLFARGNRHVSAEMLFEEASQAKVSVSLATVYNTLHEFTTVGFLRQIAVDSSKSYFDTNNTDHYHYYLEDRHELMDIPSTDLAVGRVPMPPEGYDIVSRRRGGAFAAQGRTSHSPLMG
jgi:Fur family transcriptional regulator, iron response regulator